MTISKTATRNATASRHATCGWGSHPPCSVPYAGQPYCVSEFGGIRWAPNMENSAQSWGYGNAPKTLEEFYERFAGLCRALLDAPGMFGYCYTQLTDVFQEQNGIYMFDRTPKFDDARLRAIASVFGGVMV